ncbi:GIY-YIG nuclease family protein [Xanthomonas citri pv. citri]
MAAIYALIHPVTGALRYIGKANDPADRLLSHIRDARRRSGPVQSWIRKLCEAGLTPEMVVLVDASQDWRADERRLIRSARMGGHALLNVADGGDEPSRCSDAVGGMRGYWKMMQRLGEVRRHMASIGRHADAKKADMMRARFKSYPTAAKIALGDQWLERLK